MKKPSVLVSVITRENIFAGTVRWLLTCDYPVDIMQTYSPIVHNRNLQVMQFLEQDQDYIFFLDSDTIPVPGTVERLVAATEDSDPTIIHCAPGWANMPGYPPYPAAYLAVKDKPGVYKPAAHKHERPMKVDACGMSGTLVHRDVFKGWMCPWFRAHTDGEGNWHSEDFEFFATVTRLGYQVVAHLDLVADHHRAVSLAALHAAECTGFGAREVAAPEPSR